MKPYKSIFGEEKQQQKEDYMPMGSTCGNCVFYENGDCTISAQVLKIHDANEYIAWVENPEMDNNCQLHQHRDGGDYAGDMGSTPSMM